MIHILLFLAVLVYAFENESLISNPKRRLYTCIYGEPDWVRAENGQAGGGGQPGVGGLLDSGKAKADLQPSAQLAHAEAKCYTIPDESVEYNPKAVIDCGLTMRTCDVLNSKCSLYYASCCISISDYCIRQVADKFPSFLDCFSYYVASSDIEHSCRYACADGIPCYTGKPRPPQTSTSTGTPVGPTTVTVITKKNSVTPIIIAVSSAAVIFGAGSAIGVVSYIVYRQRRGESRPDDSSSSDDADDILAEKTWEIQDQMLMVPDLEDLVRKSPVKKSSGDKPVIQAAAASTTHAMGHFVPLAETRLKADLNSKRKNSHRRSIEHTKDAFKYITRATVRPDGFGHTDSDEQQERLTRPVAPQFSRCNVRAVQVATTKDSGPRPSLAELVGLESAKSSQKDSD